MLRNTELEVPSTLTAPFILQIVFKNLMIDMNEKKNKKLVVWLHPRIMFVVRYSVAFNQVNMATVKLF